jgi:hypothetical protein
MSIEKKVENGGGQSGYSGTPLAKKLGIKDGFVVLVVNAPDGYPALLDPLPDRVDVQDAASHSLVKANDKADILHLFTNSRDDLFSGLSKFKAAIKQDGAIWVSWYKRAAKLPTEITEDTIREAAFPLGLVDVKVCAVDEKWSGLKLVIRRENRV